MSFYIFLILSVCINILLCFLVLFQRYRTRLTYPLFGLALIFPLYSLTGTCLFSNAYSAIAELWLFRLFLASYVASAFLLREFIDNFLREEKLKLAFKLFSVRLSISLCIRIMGISAIAACVALPLVRAVTIDGTSVIKCNSIFTAIIFVQLLIVLYAFFILENTFRFSQEYQRKIARFCFIGLAIILVFQVFFSGNLLLYKFFSKKMIDVASVVFGTTFPVMLIGLLRYRLGTERVAVPRDAVYSTVSLFLAGAACIGVSLTVMVFKLFNIDFEYFDRTLIIFSLCLFVLLAFGSGTMRKRISHFINNYFYSRKYDYREQFYNLHRSYMTGENVEATLTEIVENMKYSVAADDAYIFLINGADGHFYMHENKERATASDCMIRSDSILARELSKGFTMIGAAALRGKNIEKINEDDQYRDAIRADVFFPITNRGNLLGILALRLRPHAKIDEEDKALIAVFTNSIGDVLFKNKVLTERVERKQFESFSHLSSFIIHDIKNQTSTLSMVVQNAEKNITNPEFQKSLLTSLGSCAANLRNLVEKLKSPPKPDAMKIQQLDINVLVGRVIENTGIAAMSAIKFTFEKGAGGLCKIDEESLFYALKNLVVNSLEAMNNQGILTIATGPLSPVPPKLQQIFNPGKDFFDRYTTYILVSDTGKGMSAEFIEKKLFHPFVTTKDKGIGIGLYQCKTLVEKMGGKILCSSEENHGSQFCILL
jgi:putative PEP-CTERM system histidine kinase